MTMTSHPSPTISPSDLKASLELVEIKPGVRFSVATLRELLPTTETMLFFGKVYELDAKQLGHLLHLVHNSTLSKALFAEGGGHSTDLQDYLVGSYDEYGDFVPGIVDPSTFGFGQTVDDLTFKAEMPTGEILPEVWQSLEVEVADSIKAVASKLESVVGLLPGKQGSMVFGSMMKLNAKRPTIGDYRAKIQHARQKENLVILDVSGSMSAPTVETIIEDVVALSYNADASLAIVSNHTYFWPAGAYSVDTVLDKAEYGGTHYETLAPLFDGKDWGVVICVADYDSSYGAKDSLARTGGSIDLVLDISLVPQPTFLAECVGQLATEVRPLLIADHDL